MPAESRQTRTLEAAAAELEPLWERSRRRVRGEREGVRLEVAIAWGPAWRVRAALPRLSVVVDVFSRAHAPASRDTLGLDDAEFEQSYAVDGAPADLARALVDRDTRRRIEALGLERVRVCRGVVELVKRHHFRFDERAEIAEALDLAAELVRRVERLARESDAALMKRVPHAGEPYRGGPDASALSALTEARDHEVRAATRRTRRRWNKSRAAAGVVLGGWMLFEVVVQLL